MIEAGVQEFAMEKRGIEFEIGCGCSGIRIGGNEVIREIGGVRRRYVDMRICQRTCEPVGVPAGMRLTITVVPHSLQQRFVGSRRKSAIRCSVLPYTSTN
jgi:hypothetical protein